MSGFMNHNDVDEIRIKYPVGTRIELDRMDDPFAPIDAGSQGTVVSVDDAGQIHMKWDNGRSLALIPGEDSFHKVQSMNDSLNTARRPERRVKNARGMGRGNNNTPRTPNDPWGLLGGKKGKSVKEGKRTDEDPWGLNTPDEGESENRKVESKEKSNPFTADPWGKDRKTKKRNNNGNRKTESLKNNNNNNNGGNKSKTLNERLNRSEKFIPSTPDDSTKRKQKQESLREGLLIHRREAKYNKEYSGEVIMTGYQETIEGEETYREWFNDETNPGDIIEDYRDNGFTFTEPIEITYEVEEHGITVCEGSYTIEIDVKGKPMQQQLDNICEKFLKGQFFVEGCTNDGKCNMKDDIHNDENTTGERLTESDCGEDCLYEITNDDNEDIVSWDDFIQDVAENIQEEYNSELTYFDIYVENDENAGYLGYAPKGEEDVFGGLTVSDLVNMSKEDALECAAGGGITAGAYNQIMRNIKKEKTTVIDRMLPRIAETWGFTRK